MQKRTISDPGTDFAVPCIGLNKIYRRIDATTIGIQRAANLDKIILESRAKRYKKFETVSCNSVYLY